MSPIKHALKVYALGVLVLLFSCGRAEFHPDIDDSQELMFLPYAGEGILGTGEMFSVQFTERKQQIGDYWTAWYAIPEKEQESFRSFFGTSESQELIVKVKNEYFSAAVYETQRIVKDQMGNQVAVNDSIDGILIGIVQKRN